MAEYTKEEYMCVVHNAPYATKHHIYSRKAHPRLTGEERNMIPLCDELHKMWHAKGTTFMQDKFKNIRLWLIDNGWEFDPVLWKWVNFDLLKLEISARPYEQSEQSSHRTRRLICSRTSER